MKIVEFGKVIPGLKINGKDAPYPVINERDARAAAGIMLALAFIAFFYAFLLKEYIYINIIVLAFLLEFGVRMINPQLAPFYALGSFVVSKQTPEYSGAAQKRFAWGLGLTMAILMTLLIYGFGVRGPVNLTICLLCLGFLWFESVFGICLGCKMYYGLMSVGIVKKPDVAPACPGGVCAIPESLRKELEKSTKKKR